MKDNQIKYSELSQVSEFNNSSRLLF